jgi:hypothetical protein
MKAWYLVLTSLFVVGCGSNLSNQMSQDSDSIRGEAENKTLNVVFNFGYSEVYTGIGEFAPLVIPVVSVVSGSSLASDVSDSSTFFFCG